jgi:phage antirepressor YoqD-like protein
MARFEESKCITYKLYKDMTGAYKRMTEVAKPLGISRNALYDFLRELNIVEGRKSIPKYVNKGFFANKIWVKNKSGHGVWKYNGLFITTEGEKLITELYQSINKMP